MAITSFLHPRFRPIGAALRAAALPAPVAIAVVRRRAQPTAEFITRLTTTAIFAYLLGVLLPGSSQPVLAPLTAVLVVQATLYQTVRNALQRVVSVVAGVLIALALSAAVGFTWWSLGLTIAVALVVGTMLKLGAHILEVPISAMLILSLDTRSAATGRVVDTLAGAAAGLVAGMLISPVRTQPAEDAICDLSRQMADLLDEVASGLTTGLNPSQTQTWLVRARALTGELKRVDDALGEAADSLRLKPRALRFARTVVPLRNGLETLEHAAVTIRGLARSIADHALQAEDDADALAVDAPGMLAETLRQLAAAIRTFGGLIRADLAAGRVADRHRLERHVAEARQQQDKLAPILRQAPDNRSEGWRLRGEMLVHLDRLTSELQVDHLGSAPDNALHPLWLKAARLVSPRQRQQAGPGGTGATRNSTTA